MNGEVESVAIPYRILLPCSKLPQKCRLKKEACTILYSLSIVGNVGVLSLVVLILDFS